MKKIIPIALFVLSLLNSTTTFAQPWITQEDIVLSKRQFTDQEMGLLKATKTVFFFPAGTKAHNDSIKFAVKQAWDLTPLIFDDYSNANKYFSDPTYSYFIFDGIISTGQYGTSTHYYMTLQVPVEVTKKGKIKMMSLCRIELFPTIKTMKDGFNDMTVENLYSHGVYYNFTPVLLKAQIQTVESNLKNNYRPKLSLAIKTDSLSQLLSKDTLYVPTSFLIEYNPYSEKDKEKKDNPFLKYPYSYKFCTDSELYNIFLVQKRGRFLFEYVKSSSDKFVTIYDLLNKDAIYRRYTPISYNLKQKDVEAITR